MYMYAYDQVHMCMYAQEYGGLWLMSEILSQILSHFIFGGSDSLWNPDVEHR